MDFGYATRVSTALGRGVCYCLLFKTSPNDSEQHDGNDSSPSQEGFVEINLAHHHRLCRAGCVFVSRCFRWQHVGEKGCRETFSFHRGHQLGNAFQRFQAKSDLLSISVPSFIEHNVRNEAGKQSSSPMPLFPCQLLMCGDDDVLAGTRHEITHDRCLDVNCVHLFAYLTSKRSLASEEPFTGELESRNRVKPELRNSSPATRPGEQALVGWDGVKSDIPRSFLSGPIQTTR
jgi:hypothetical protein